MTDQPRSPTPDVDAAEHAGRQDAEAHDGVASQQPRRQPGEPHPYMLQRNPPNLWILVALTAFSLVLAVVILALTVIL